MWAGFDDVRSIDLKVKYLIESGLGGAMLFSLDHDDFKGNCGQDRFPLSRVIKYHLDKNIQVKYPDQMVYFGIDNIYFYQTEEEDDRKWLASFNITASNNCKTITIAQIYSDDILRIFSK